jgi:nuclear protein localization protein 4 homolog
MVSIRVRTPCRQVVLEVAEGAKGSELRSKVSEVLGIPLTSTILYSKPDYSSQVLPSSSSTANDSATLSSLKIVHGSLLFSKNDSAATSTQTAGTAVASSSISTSSNSTTTTTSKGLANSTTTTASASTAVAVTSSPKRQLTSRCQHGDKGACQHCSGATEADMEAHKKTTLLNKAGGRHAERSAASLADASSASSGTDIEWLCQHRPEAMCVNCAPLRKPGEKEHLEMLCLHGPGGQCVNCLPPDTTVDDRKFVTYDEFIEKRKAKCEHAFSAMCVNCMPPSQVRYALKQDCSRHKPWPGGLCTDCQPPTVKAKLQEYRHVDFITFMNDAEAQSFVSLWDINASAGVQRVAFLYGTIEDDKNYRHGQRVIIEAMYEPPQIHDARTGAIAIKPDPRTKDVEAIAAACGLRRVGWFFTQRPKTKSSDPAVQPRELCAMARMQLVHPRVEKGSGSQFVTVTVRRNLNEKGQVKMDEGIEPKGFMASDTMMAMVRDNVLADPLPSDSLIRMKLPRPNTSDPPAPEVIVASQNGQVQRRGTEFDPDLAIVTVEIGYGQKGSGRSCRFKHATFPVENREAFGIVQSAAALRSHLIKYKSEKLAHALSDFHLLIYLAQVFDVNTAAICAKCAVSGGEVPEGLELMLREIQG